MPGRHAEIVSGCWMLPESQSLAESGGRAPAASGTMARAAHSAYMKRDHLVVGVDLGMGRGKRTVWTCDLTHGYIDINADYRS